MPIHRETDTEDVIHTHTHVMDLSLVVLEGLAQLSEAKNHAMQGYPRWMGHSGEF